MAHSAALLSQGPFSFLYKNPPCLYGACFILPASSSPAMTTLPSPSCALKKHGSTVGSSEEQAQTKYCQLQVTVSGAEGRWWVAPKPLNPRDTSRVASRDTAQGCGGSSCLLSPLHTTAHYRDTCASSPSLAVNLSHANYLQQQPRARDGSEPGF